MSGEENVRQRNRVDKTALKEKVEMIKSKMKETEASQQRKQNVMTVLKPFLYLIVIILLFFVLYIFLMEGIGSREGSNIVIEDNHGSIEEVEEIIAEVEGE